jgi:single-strand DNA-binding protein
MNINHVIINVSLVANPTLRETNTGTLVATATIANNEFFNDDKGERQQVTTFVDVTVRGESGENFASLAKKGQEVVTEGQLRRNDLGVRRRLETFQALPESRTLSVHSK